MKLISVRRTFAACAAVSFIVCGVTASIGAETPDVVKTWDSIKADAPPPIKAVTIDAKTTAVISMDFNSKTCTAAKRKRCDAALPAVKKVLDEARAKKLMVVHTYIASMKEGDIVKSVAPKSGEPALVGSANKFYGTDLEKQLKDKGIKTVILMGTAANGAVLFSAFGAAERHFKVIVPIDTMPGDTPYAEQISIWEMANGPTVRNATTLTRSDMLSWK